MSTISSPDSTNKTGQVSGPQNTPDPAPKSKSDTAKFSTMGQLNKAHPEVIEVMKKTLAMSMLNELKHQEDARKQRMRQLKAQG